MISLINSFKDFCFVYFFFRIKKLLLIFFLYSLCTILETLNVALILPLVSFLFGDQNNIESIKILSFLDLKNLFQNDNFIYYISFFIIILFGIKSIILIMSSKIQTNFFAQIRYKISSFFFNYYISKPYIYFLNEKKSSEIMRNATMLSSNYAGFLERFLMLTNDFFIFLGVIIIMIFYTPKVFIILFLFFLIFIIIYTFLTNAYFFDAGKKLLDLSSSMLKDIQESLNNIIQIKLLKKESYFEKSFAKKTKENSFKIANLTFLQSIPRILVEFSAVLVLFSLISFLVYDSYSKKEITYILTLFTIAVLRLFPFVIKLITFINTANSFIPSLNLLKKEILKIDNEKKESEKTVNHLEILKAYKIDKINLNNIDYFYPTSNSKLFENINLELNKNNIYGILGPSGSGKTTLLNIICGLIEPTNGSVKYNNEDLKSRKFLNIAYVSQNSFFRNDTIRNNIAFGLNDFEIDEKKIYECLKKVDLYELVNTFDKKIDTYINELGSNFSGGQLQRLSIARAIYSNTDIIIFDEPTSSLDENTKVNILKSINNLKNGKIIIIISHLIEDMKICSKVYNIENKNLKEFNAFK
jgi:ABC-type multidrug transport system fused ATPase/permease subunit